MEFIIPEFNRKESIIGIYKIWFDDKWFYVGSSRNLRSRFSTWKAGLTSGNFKSINIRKILPEISIIRIELLQTYKSASWLRRNETKEINKHWGNPLFLNRCPDANSPKGMKPYFGYIKPPKPPLKGIPEYMKPIRVALFKKNGEFIKIFNSRNQLYLATKIKTSTITLIMEGKRGQPRNYILKQVSDDGTFLEPIKYTNTKCRKIIQLDSRGNTISVYSSISDAARSLGGINMYKGNLMRVLSGAYGYKTVKGFVFKYA